MRVNISSETVLIDEQDAHLLNEFTWRIHYPYKGAKPYVSAKIWQNGKSKRVYLHKFICSKKKEVDHINRNTLDNRRSNLRICTSSQNKMNIGIRANKLTCSKGVSLKSGKYFIARARTGGVEIYLGCFKTERGAAMAYDKYVRKNYKGFALTNEDLK